MSSEELTPEELAKLEEKKARTKARMRAYYLANRDKLIERSRTRWAATREKTNELRRARRKAEPEKTRAQDRAASQRNRDKRLEWAKARYAADGEKERARSKAWRKANLEKAKAYNDAWRKANAEKIREYKKTLRATNPEKLRASGRAHYRANSKDIIARNKAYRQQNPDKVAANHKRRKETDPAYRIARACRSRLNDGLTRKGFDKSRPSEDLVGCSWNDLRVHLERQFTNGMTWENHGKVWHVDHIIPCAKFDMTKPEEQRACFHYTNLRPLCARLNVRERDRKGVPQQATMFHLLDTPAP